MILSPDETMKIGGYAYKGGRVILENFTDSLTEMINEKSSVEDYDAPADWFLLER